MARVFRQRVGIETASDKGGARGGGQDQGRCSSPIMKPHKSHAHNPKQALESASRQGRCAQGGGQDQGCCNSLLNYTHKTPLAKPHSQNPTQALETASDRDAARKAAGKIRGAPSTGIILNEMFEAVGESALIQVCGCVACVCTVRCVHFQGVGQGTGTAHTAHTHTRHNTRLYIVRGPKGARAGAALRVVTSQSLQWRQWSTQCPLCTRCCSYTHTRHTVTRAAHFCARAPCRDQPPGEAPPFQKGRHRALRAVCGGCVCCVCCVCTPVVLRAACCCVLLAAGPKPRRV